MDILSYLTTLIKTHKEVGIPGLGTIYKRKSPGRYDTDTHSFLPPSYTLAFTSDLKEQELLTNIISKEKNISADAATYFAEQFAQNILDELSNQQESDFGSLGTFSTASGSLTFIPKQDQNFGFDFYGLPALKDTSLVLPAKAEEDTTEEETQVTKEQLELENNNADLGDGSELTEAALDPVDYTGTDDVLLSHIDRTEEQLPEAVPDKDDQPVYEEIAEVASPVQPENQQPEPLIESPEELNEEQQEEEKEQPIIFEPLEPVDTAYITEQQEKRGTPVYLKVTIALLAVAAIAAIAYAIKPELFKGAAVNEPRKQDNTQAIKENDQRKADSIARADSTRISNEKAIMAIDSAKGLPVSPQGQTSADTIISYDIIAASLLNKKEADQFLADMKKRGIPAKVSKMRGKRIKISIGSFLDEDSAKKELEVLKKTTKIPGIYITPIRHTNNPK